MSHFAVAVLSNEGADIYELLAPYDEAIEVAPYINRTKQQMIDDAKKQQKEKLEKIERFKKLGKQVQINGYMQKILDAKTDEDFYQSQVWSDKTYDTDGNELSTYNPKSKWDWYEIGGRWSGLLNVKTETGIIQADVAKLKDIDFSIDKEEYKRLIRFWEVAIEGLPINPDENPDDFGTFYKKEYYIDRYKNKELYARINASFSTYAVITPDGEWHQKGEMGWFGMSSESGDESLNWDLNFYDNFFKNADPETIVTIVDCHI